MKIYLSKTKIQSFFKKIVRLPIGFLATVRRVVAVVVLVITSPELMVWWGRSTELHQLCQCSWPPRASVPTRDREKEGERGRWWSDRSTDGLLGGWWVASGQWSGRYVKDKSWPVGCNMRRLKEIELGERD